MATLYRDMAFYLIVGMTLNSCGNNLSNRSAENPNDSINHTLIQYLDTITWNHESETKIGPLIWMKRNLDVDTFLNGDRIREARSNEEWNTAAMKKEPVWCYYNNDTSLGKKYGRIYNYYAVLDKRNIAPKGWHLPTSDEWGSLLDNVSTGDFVWNHKLIRTKSDIISTRLKTLNDWPKNKNGNDESGFSALPGGYRSDNGSFSGIGTFAYFWNSWIGIDAIIIPDDYSDPNYSMNTVPRDSCSFCFNVPGYYIRCVKDY